MNFLGLPTHLPNSGSLPLLPEAELNPEQSVADTKAEEPTRDEELQQPSESVVFIPGTTISLQTDEDIAKWIEERRKKWPTKRNIEQKELAKEQEERSQLQKKRLQPQDLPIAKKRRIEQQEGTEPDLNLSRKQVCKFYEKNKRCRYGTKCRNLHESGGSASSDTQTKHHALQAFPAMKVPRNCVVKAVNGVKVLVPQRYKGTNSSSSLFANLVQQDKHEFENNIALEFIQFLDSQNLINHDVFKP